MRRGGLLGLLLIPVLMLGACGLFGPSSRSFVVFFQQDSAQLDAAATSVIAGAADWAKQHPDKPVTVAGFADVQGSVQANKNIADARAQAVVSALIADGLPSARVQKQSIGAAVSAPGSLQQSRRVDITVGTP